MGLPILVGGCQVGSWEALDKDKRESTECSSLSWCPDAWMCASHSDYEATLAMGQERDVEGADADVERAQVPGSISEQDDQPLAAHFLTRYVRKITPSCSNYCFLTIVVAHPNTDLLETTICL